MRRPYRATPLLLAVALGGCSILDGDPAALTLADGETLFLAQSRPPGAVMEALFDGRVVRDERGCLRLDVDGGAATVVWPYGFELSASLEVHDGSGRRIGEIGERFRFGGGFIAELHEGIDLSAATREQARTRCPGSFWIVGEVL